MVLVDCHKCHVLVPVGDQQQKVEARVVHKRDDVHIYFPVQNLKDIRIKTKAIFYDDYQGILSATCELVIRRNLSATREKEPWLADCKILEMKRAEQNLRSAVRIKTDIDMEFASSHHGNFRASIKDLSVGGMQLSTSQLLHRNERLAFNWTLTGVPSRIDAIVIRGWAQPDGKYAYGCRFVNLSDKTEAAIGSYLFKRQQEIRKEIQ
ncbi:MAG: PilZ domain-containing protein [Lachnospiraceae bacterium]|nr:PilZ domain-containing protein [Lachnospiraceae bacterium]